ncbi:hypothetical protein Tco_0074869, partial [Tanacetum coccineum]
MVRAQLQQTDLLQKNARLQHRDVPKMIDEPRMMVNDCLMVHRDQRRQILMDRLEWPGLELRGQEASDDHPLESQNIHQTSVETAAPNLYWWE